MEKGTHLKRKNQPTMTQIRYVLELDKLEKKKGAQGEVARICGVNASTVYRFFKSCMEQGYLDEELTFTKAGRAWIDRYKNLIVRLEKYLTDIGGTEDSVKETMDNLLENVELYMLELMLKEYEQQKSVVISKKKQLNEDVIYNIRRYGNYQVKYGIYRLNRRPDTASLSMAMHGFEERAEILWEEDIPYLVLKIRALMAKSRLDGKERIGYLDMLRYEDNSRLITARAEEGRIYIPISACEIHYYQGGSIVGKVSITVTSSVGRQHMPESTALLIFWL